MTIGEAIHAIRIRLRESQQAFSYRLNVSMMTVSRWERDSNRPMPDKLAALSHIARSLDLVDAAEALEAEAGALFKTVGRDMLQRVWRQFAMISGALIRFQSKARERGIDIPADARGLLESALNLALSCPEPPFIEAEERAAAPFGDLLNPQCIRNGLDSHR